MLVPQRVLAVAQVAAAQAHHRRQAGQARTVKASQAAQPHQAATQRAVAVAVLVLSVATEVRAPIRAARVAQVSHQASRVRRKLVAVVAVVAVTTMRRTVAQAAQVAAATAQAHHLLLPTAQRTRAAAVVVAAMTVLLVLVATVEAVSCSCAI